MLKADHPLRALEEVLKYDFWNIIFEIPEGSDLKDANLKEAIPTLGFNCIAQGI